MDTAEAKELIRDAVPTDSDGSDERTWADLGAGSGTFTFALAELIGPAGRVIAVDRETAALDSLRRGLQARGDADREPTGSPGGGLPEKGAAAVTPAAGDFRDPATIAALDAVALDGALFANALHFDGDPGLTLRRFADRLAANGRIVVVEYQDRPPNPWVPHPLPVARLEEVAAARGLSAPRVVGERPSSYGGILYCAWLQPG